MSDVVMLVANPDVPCLRNLQRLTRCAAAGRRRARNGCASCSIARRRTASLPVAQIEKVLGRAIDFQVPSDYRTVAAAAMNTGVPVSALAQLGLQATSTLLAQHDHGAYLAAPVSSTGWAGDYALRAQPDHGRAEVRLGRVPELRDERGGRASRRCTAARCTPFPRP